MKNMEIAQDEPDVKEDPIDPAPPQLSPLLSPSSLICN
jgi:hypothetical protein